MRINRKVILGLVIFFNICIVIPGQQRTAPGTTLIAIKAGKLLDVRTGNLKTNVFINIRNDRIVSVSNLPSEGATIVDLSNQTVLPGLIDCHVHLLSNPKDQSSVAVLRMSSPQGAIWGAHNLLTYLNEGFTTVRDACETDTAYGQF